LSPSHFISEITDIDAPLYSFSPLLSLQLIQSEHHQEREMLKKLKNQKGQSMLEYVILTSLIGIFCVVGVKTFGKRIKTRINQVNEQIEEHIVIQ